MADVLATVLYLGFWLMVLTVVRIVTPDPTEGA
jgi:hypothetical protein